jgi:hypothetical protein
MLPPSRRGGSVVPLEPSTSLTVLRPEPQKDGGGPMPQGAELDAALARVRQAYEGQGIERVGESLVWWRLAAR